ncbi:MAG TPA: VOC family protein [Actinopolymorphaceae bacterium]|nr:VOC family protein [Actinopolymorphaceae bacterium]
MIYELNHVGIRIRDLDKSLAFYTGRLGGEVVSEAYIPSSRTDCVYLQVADGLVELLRPADPPPGATFGLDHIAFMTDDLDGEHQRLAAAGFAFSVLPKVAGTGRGRLAFLSDPSGVRVELLQREENFRIPPLPGGPVRSLDHYSVAADDLAASVAFYGGKLGLLPLATLTDTDEHATLSYFHLGSDSVELAHTAEPAADAPRIRHIALRVDDAEATTTTFRAAGVPVEPGYPRATGTGHGQVAAIRDPDGVRLLLLDRKDLNDLPPDVLATHT